MSKLIKVRQIIKLSGWVNGSGWSYKNSVYDDQIIDIDSDDLNNMDWDWWETDEENPPSEESDTEIVVEFYAEDADTDEDKPIASHSIWVSEIYKERHISAAAAAMGRKGGKSKSAAKVKASVENGKLGGRPRTIEDGWHTISGYECYVEDGLVLRATIGEGNGQTSAAPYRYDKKLGVWNKCTPRVATLKNGLAKGTYEIM